MASLKNKTEKIHKPYLIMCEGEDELRFLISFLNCSEVEDYPFFANDVQVINFGGNEELPLKLNVLKITPGFEQVKSLLILRDAEKDAQVAIRQIQNGLTKAGLPTPSEPGKWEGKNLKTGFLLFPTCDTSVHEGTLEDLCLSILKEDASFEILTEIDTFLKLLEERHQREFRHEFKAKLHTYFSITDKFVGMKIGEAANAGAFDWNSVKLNSLKTFLLAATESDL